MRLLEKNKQNLKYALQVGEVPIYERDEDGNIIYIEVDGQKVPVETGETEVGYSNPIDFRGNIAMSGGEAEAKSFGVDISEYDAVLLMEKDRIPIDETSLGNYRLSQKSTLKSKLGTIRRITRFRSDSLRSLRNC